MADRTFVKFGTELPALAPPRHAPDPLALAEQVQNATVTYPLVTNGADRGIDALAVVCKILEALTEDERAALLGYVSSRFGAACECRYVREEDRCGL